jgi:hypothetical protein
MSWIVAGREALAAPCAALGHCDDAGAADAVACGMHSP